MIKRQRGRGRKPGQQNPNRAYESTGPDIKVRGSAQTVFEKYQQLGRDANSSGDRVLAENYLQHAEHYFRLLKTMQPTFVPRSELVIAGFGADEDWDDEDGDENADNEGPDTDGGEGSEQPQRREFRDQRDQRDRGPRGDGRNGQDRGENRGGNRFEQRPDFRQDTRPEARPDNRNEAQGEGEETDSFGRRRNRRRRERFRADGTPYEDNGPRGENGAEARPRPDVGDMPAPQEPASFALRKFAPQPEPVQASAPVEAAPALRVQQMDFTPLPESDAPKPRRERAPRRPRAESAAPAPGFGDEVPAFLSAGPISEPGE